MVAGRPTEPGGDAPPGYVLLGELGRGGMGAVLRGYDPDLGRDVAVKRILDAHAGRPDLVRRFVEEARVAGRLQHPGVVPVYGLGRLADGRPYFTMRVVEGRTLAELLAARADPADDRPRLLKLFEQVCQAVAYAHSRGVVHRDLKPANVMAGAFGEVQVMDWGLAKVLGRPDEPTLGGVGPNPDGPPDDSRTQAGAVLGTPAYMPPEQARGETDRVDERADVFSLGAILCEILTGRPPHAGGGAAAVHQKAARGDVSDALARLDRCGADADLTRLAARCLASDPADRPRDAGVLAADLADYLDSVERRLRAAELEGAEARARAEQERVRREAAVAAQAVLRRALARQVAERLEGELGRVEAVAHALADLAAGRDDWDEPQLVAWMDAALGREDRVFGLCLAFEPGRFRPGEDDFALYRFRGGPGGAAVTKVFRPPAYPYRAMDWYRLPLAAGAAGWTEPFVDADGGDIPMVTYAVPFRRGGEPAGVATVDLSAAYFGRLGEWVRELDFGPASYGVVFSRAGVVVSHPDPACDFAARAAAGVPPLHAERLSPGDEAFRALAERILGEPAGTGSAADPVSGRPATWVFHRVRSPGWTFAAVVPDDRPPTETV